MLLTAGCTSLEATGAKQYVTGDGTVSQLAPAGRGAPVELTGEDLDGDPLDLASYRGSPVVVSVWGAWCVECREEAELVTELATELDGTAAFVGVDVRDPSVEAARAYVRTYAVPFPSFYSPDGTALLAFSGTLTPYTVPAFVVLDAEGRLAASILGQLPSRLTLVELVEDVAAETPGEPAMGEWFQETAFSGSLVLAVPVALLAGLVSFFSPCVIPLLPGYLSYATGLSGADLAGGESGRRRGRMLLGSVLFVAGFAVVFVSLGALSGAAGAWLVTWRRELTVVMGSLVIVLGLAFAGLLPMSQREWRVHRVPAVGLAAAPLLGFLFGLGWTPCIGPTLAAITTLSINEATVGRGALLSGVYALGLGLPFIAAGLAYRRALGALSFVRRHQAWVTRAGGLMLVVVGVLLVTGWWDQAVVWLQIRFVSTTELAI